MADGKTHALVGSLIVGAGAMLTVVASADPVFALPTLPFAVGLVNGYFVTPDIDIDHITEEERRWFAVPVIGFFLGAIFATFWYPYALWFAHRGVSHWPVIGTATRFIYQFSGFFIFFIILQSLSVYFTGATPVHIETAYLTVRTESWTAFFVGWAVQDFGHLLLDWRELWHLFAATWNFVKIAFLLLLLGMILRSLYIWNF